MFVQKMRVGETYLLELILSGLLLVTPDALAVDFNSVDMGVYQVDVAVEDGQGAYLNRSDSIWSSVADDRVMLLSEGSAWDMSVGLDREILDQSSWNFKVYFTSAFD
ncbi:MAG: hypothetical protein R3189_09835 [Thiomicrorhabdus chilensis]|uniref:hypothetical protein n=1 Tax=Thiomicrorhabdus chilensis TaxID=63656 RepID=UPI00299DFF95|nr:hypothetical protein [Thiomicrorhabdus chilensis]MDX1348533.1 hypothetical protein [Thiomicrorhabdus chilensis]